MGKRVNNQRINRTGGIFGWHLRRFYWSRATGQVELMITTIWFTPQESRLSQAMSLRERRRELSRQLAIAKQQ